MKLEVLVVSRGWGLTDAAALGVRWRSLRRSHKGGAYLFNHKALAKVLRGKLVAALREQGLWLPPNLPKDWMVDCKSVGSGEKASRRGLLLGAQALYRHHLRDSANRLITELRWRRNSDMDCNFSAFTRGDDFVAELKQFPALRAGEVSVGTDSLVVLGRDTLHAWDGAMACLDHEFHEEQTGGTVASRCKCPQE